MDPDAFTDIEVTDGEPYIGKSIGKSHPKYLITLSSQSGVKHARAYRFRVLRSFHNDFVAPSKLVNGYPKFPPGRCLAQPFPETSLLSSFGIPMSSGSLSSRRQGLDSYFRAFFSLRNEWAEASENLKQATLQLLEVSEDQIWPSPPADPLTLARREVAERRATLRSAETALIDAEAELRFNVTAVKKMKALTSTISMELDEEKVTGTSTCYGYTQSSFLASSVLLSTVFIMCNF